MKVFAVERHGLPEDFVYFRALCGVQSSPLVFAPNRAFGCGPLGIRHREGFCVSCMFCPELIAEVKQGNTSIS